MRWDEASDGMKPAHCSEGWLSSPRRLSAKQRGALCDPVTISWTVVRLSFVQMRNEQVYDLHDGLQLIVRLQPPQQSTPRLSLIDSERVVATIAMN